MGLRRETLERVRWAGVFLSAAVLVGFGVAAAVTLLRQRGPGRAGAPPDAAPPAPIERRFAGLDRERMAGARIETGDGEIRFEIGTVTVRKRKAGFIRIGAFQEAVFGDVRLWVGVGTLGASGAAAVASFDPEAPAIDAGGRDARPAGTAVAPDREALEPAGAARPAALDGRLEEIGSRLGDLARAAAPAGTRLSGYIAAPCALYARRADGSEARLAVCERVTPVRRGMETRLQLHGPIEFRDLGGHAVACEAAHVLLGTPLLVIAKTRDTADATGPIVRFRLADLLEPGFLARVAIRGSGEGGE